MDLGKKNPIIFPSSHNGFSMNRKRTKFNYDYVTIFSLNLECLSCKQNMYQLQFNTF